MASIRGGDAASLVQVRSPVGGFIPDEEAFVNLCIWHLTTTAFSRGHDVAHTSMRHHNYALDVTVYVTAVLLACLHILLLQHKQARALWSAGAYHGRSNLSPISWRPASDSDVLLNALTPHLVDTYRSFLSYLL
ncbi:hypothetical protein MRB53_041823 [Persea americana]|nr:hypothetical protein MRB53_041823 [Persea americana]